MKTILLVSLLLISIGIVVLFRKGMRDAKEMPDDYEDLAHRIDRAMFDEVLKRKLKKIIEEHKNNQS